MIGVGEDRGFGLSSLRSTQLGSDARGQAWHWATAVMSLPVLLQLTGCAGPGPTGQGPHPSVETSTPRTTPTADSVECPPTPLVVEISYELTRDPTGGILVDVTSNLPDTAELMASFYRDGGAYFAQDVQAVSTGTARFGPFSDDGVPLKGTYEVSITLPIARNQPETVRACLGEAGELMTGPLVSQEPITGDFVAAVEQIVDLD